MNLLGVNYNQGYISLTGAAEIKAVEQYDAGRKDFKKLNDLKVYLNDTFVQPLLVRDLEYIQNNKYNFTYLNSQLLKCKHINPKEVELYMQIVRFAQEAVVIMQKNEELEDKLQNNEGFMGIVTHVPSIILKPEFEIYKTFFGMPPRGKFDIEAIKTIRNLIKTLTGATYSVIESELLEIYKRPEKRTIGEHTYAPPIRKGGDPGTEQTLYGIGDTDAFS